MKMFGLLLVAAVLVSVKATPTNKNCSLVNVKSCEDYDLISIPRFHGFVPENELDDLCGHVIEALTCADEVMKGCSLYEKLLFDTPKGVIDMICKTRVSEYLKSIGCFAKLEVKEAVITKCMSSLPPSKTFQNPCSNLLQAPSCSYDEVLAVKGCTEIDASFMKDLVKAFLKPTVDVFKCPVLVDSKDIITAPTVSPNITENSGDGQTVSPSITGKAGDGQTTVILQPKTTSSAEVKVNLLKVLQTDNQLSYILSALQPRVQIEGLPACRDTPMVQVNNFIFLNSLFQAPNNSSRNNQ